MLVFIDDFNGSIHKGSCLINQAKKLFHHPTDQRIPILFRTKVIVSTNVKLCIKKELKPE